MNAPIFFMNMISPLQKIIIIKILLPIRRSLIISIVRNPSAMILHQEIVLEHESCYVTLKIDLGTSGSLAVTQVFPSGHFWSPVVTSGHQNVVFDESEYDSKRLLHSWSINTVNEGLEQIKNI